MTEPTAPPEEHKLNQATLDSLPHWAMLIQRSTRTILTANARAKDGGAVVQGQCWDDFGHRAFVPPEKLALVEKDSGRKRDCEIKCDFCEADEAMERQNPTNRVEVIDGLTWDIWWVPVSDDLYLHYAIDITAIKEAEKIKLDAARLEAAVATAGSVCHEMNQPLQTISWLAEMMAAQAGSNPELSRQLEQLTEAVERMGKITAKLNSIIRFELKEYLPGVEILDLDGSAHPDRADGGDQ